MDEPTTAPTPEPAPAAQGGGLLQNIVDIWFVPREAFGRIVAHPRWLLPLIGHVILAVTFTAVWVHYMEPEEFMKIQLQEAGQWDKLNSEQREMVVEQQAPFVVGMSWASAFVFSPLLLVVIAAVLLFVFRFFYAGEVTFKQALAIVAWTFLAFGIVTTPMTLGVMALKGEWNINPQHALQANPTFFLDQSETSRPLWTLVAGLDLFVLWLLFLLATGFAVACRKSTGSAFWGVALPWALIVAVQVGMAALF